jgi:lipopolysaccharide transport protein LptA
MTPAHSSKRTGAFAGMVGMLLTMLPLVAWALSADRDKELSYSADGNSTIATQEGVRVVTVRENVFIKQGSMELRGHEAVFEYDQENGELRRVSVTGSPASFQQLPENSNDLITGSSNTIYYHLGGENRIEFIGAATFTQSGSVMNCVEIRHSIDSGITEMTGPCSGTLPPQSIE